MIPNITGMFTMMSLGREGTLTLDYLLNQSQKFYNNVFLFVDLTTLFFFYLILIGWLIKLSVQKFQPIIVIFRKGNFVWIYINLSAIVLSFQIPELCYYQLYYQYKPEAARGWPRAMAPPQVLNFSMGMSRAFWQDRAWAPNASLISTWSTSPRETPAFSIMTPKDDEHFSYFVQLNYAILYGFFSTLLYNLYMEVI